MTNPQICFADTYFDGLSLLYDRREVIRRTTVKAQLQKLRDTGRFDCFKLQWHPVYDEDYPWPVPKSLFWDSDIAKWIEGACYFLTQSYDQDVDAAVCELVQDICRAQQDDGYLNVYFTVVDPAARWSNIRDQHELYNAGHLIEAALAHCAYYHTDVLLKPIEKYVALLYREFGPGPGQRRAYPGHPEIELALLRLHKATGSMMAYDLARYFLEERGTLRPTPCGSTSNNTGDNTSSYEGALLLYYDWEEKKRGDSPWKRPNAYPEARTSHWYNQAHVPIREQKSVEGHAVRSMYLLTAVADMVYIGVERPVGDEMTWKTALDRLWNNMVDKKMSMTGGIGAIAQWEGFGRDYFLPQGTDEGGCYNETCAAIGVMMLAERLLELDLDSRYADIMELCLYNAVLTAMSLDGKSFTYINQLSSSDTNKSERYSWFECACCPPNLMRLFGSLGGYLWDYNSGPGSELFVNVHLYTSATLSFCLAAKAGDQVENKGQMFRLRQASNWPWDGQVTFFLEVMSSVRITIRLRLPAWAKGNFTINPSCDAADIQKGYLVLPPSYLSNNSTFKFNIGGFSPRLLAPHPYTGQNTVTVARGPLVYCVEDYDNPWVKDHFKSTCISSDAAITEQPRTLGSTGHAYVALHVTGWEGHAERWWEKESPGSSPSHEVLEGGSYLETERGLVLIPYYLRANRGGKGQMRVGLLRKD